MMNVHSFWDQAVGTVSAWFSLHYYFTVLLFLVQALYHLVPRKFVTLLCLVAWGWSMTAKTARPQRIARLDVVRRDETRLHDGKTHPRVLTLTFQMREACFRSPAVVLVAGEHEYKLHRSCNSYNSTHLTQTHFPKHFNLSFNLFQASDFTHSNNPWRTLATPLVGQRLLHACHLEISADPWTVLSSAISAWASEESKFTQWYWIPTTSFESKTMHSRSLFQVFNRTCTFSFVPSRNNV